MSGRTRVLLAGGALAGLLVAAVTGWWVAVLVLPAAAAGLPVLLTAPPSASRIGRLEAMEEWTRALSGVLTAGVGLEQALLATVRSTPDPIRPEVTRLVSRLRARWATEDALRAFADDLDDATGDVIAANLILGARRRGAGLASVLDGLAESVAADVRARREIEADRAKPRATARWVTIITVGVLAVLALSGQYVAPYGSPLGQVLLVAPARAVRRHPGLDALHGDRADRCPGSSGPPRSRCTHDSHRAAARHRRRRARRARGRPADLAAGPGRAGPARRPGPALPAALTPNAGDRCNRRWGHHRTARAVGFEVPAGRAVGAHPDPRAGDPAQTAVPVLRREDPLRPPRAGHPPLLTVLFNTFDAGLPLYIPVFASIALAAVMFLLPDYNARDDARQARTEFSRALGAYIDLVALERHNGAGPRQAMEAAATIGDSWVFTRLSEELARTRWSGLTPWEALRALADELGLPELDDLADIMRLSGEEGAQVYASLRARSAAMRTAMLNTEKARANEVAERMTIPMSLLGVIFLAILVAPALMRVIGGGT